MGLLSSAKSSQSQVTVTDRGRLVSGAAARLIESGSFMLERGAKYTETGGVTVGDKGTLKTGTD